MGDRGVIEKLGKGLEVRLSYPKDCKPIADDIRVEDELEIAASIGMSPLDGLLWSCEASRECFTLWKRNEPVAMFGTGPIAGHPGVGFVWLLGTDKIREVVIPFLRHSKRWLDLLLSDYQVLTNVCDARNALHIRWLEWLGFKFHGLRKSHGVAGLPFHEFSICAPLSQP